MYPLKSQFCTHLSDSIRIDMYSFVKALFHCSSHGCRTITAKSWIHKGISMKSFRGEREREGSLHQHLIPMMQLFKWRSAAELLCFHWWTGIQIKEQSMSDRSDLQLCINIWLLTSPQTHRQNQDCMFRICPESLKFNALIFRLPTSEGQSSGFIFCSFSMRFAVFVTLTQFGKIK